jgi:hypothetical protein
MVVASVLMSLGMMMVTACHHLAAVQADAVRAGGRLAADHRLAGGEFLHMKATMTSWAPQPGEESR